LFQGCGRYAGGQGYNSIGHFCGGWAGNCGDGGIGGSPSSSTGLLVAIPDVGSHPEWWRSCCTGKKFRKVAKHPGAVKCHWLARQLRDPALWELAILVTKLDTCV